MIYLFFNHEIKTFLLVFQNTYQTNEHDIIYLYGFLVFIFVGKGPIYAMTFGLRDYLCHKTPEYWFLCILHEENNVVFFLIFQT